MEQFSRPASCFRGPAQMDSHNLPTPPNSQPEPERTQSESEWPTMEMLLQPEGPSARAEEFEDVLGMWHEEDPTPQSADAVVPQIELDDLADLPSDLFKDMSENPNLYKFYCLYLLLAFYYFV